MIYPGCIYFGSPCLSVSHFTPLHFMNALYEYSMIETTRGIPGANTGTCPQRNVENSSEQLIKVDEMIGVRMVHQADGGPCGPS